VGRNQEADKKGVLWRNQEAVQPSARCLLQGQELEPDVLQGKEQGLGVLGTTLLVWQQWQGLGQPRYERQQKSTSHPCFVQALLLELFLQHPWSAWFAPLDGLSPQYGLLPMHGLVLAVQLFRKKRE
jgi:hypothetical protein